MSAIRQNRRARVTADRHHRPRMGRHPGAQHAAAALVAVAVLRHDRLGGRLLDRLSGVAAGVLVHAAACSTGTRASAVVSRSRRAARQQRGPMMAQARRGSLQEIESTTRAARLRPRAGRARFRRQLRAVPRRRRRRRQGLSQSQRRRLAVGRHARRRSSRRSATASAPATTPAIRARMPAFGRDGMLKPDEISAVADYVRSLSGLPTDAGRRSRARRKKIFADNCAVCHGAGRQGQSRSRRAESDRQDLALWLGQDRPSWRASWNGRGGVMPAWGGRLDDVTIKALAVYVHTFGGGEK